MRRTYIISFAFIIVACCTYAAWAASPDAAMQGASSPGEKLPGIDPVIKSKTSQGDVICPTADEEARKLYNEAIDLEAHGKFAEAKEKYLKAIERDPGYCDAMDNIGVIFRHEGDISQAIHWYERSIAVKPDNPVAHQDLAVAYSIRGDAEKTLAEYRWLAGKYPENPEGFYGLGMTFLGLNQPQDAVRPLERAEELYRASSSPLIGDARHLLGVACFGLKDYARARDYLTLSYAGLENDADVNYLLGLCYIDPSIKDIGKAREYLFKARQLGKTIPPELLRELDEVTGPRDRPF
ncbi:MAG TPA: tetratricopeptide repeat protein [Geobacteraceae bacterium]|nr:tetratricopeptide repeat protein [Geobacteraceae bacterium]